MDDNNDLIYLKVSGFVAGIFPDSWKCATAVAIPKKGDSRQLNNISANFVVADYR